MPDNAAEKKEINIRNKAIGAMILILVLSVPVCAALYFLGGDYSALRETQLEQMNRKVLADISAYANRQYLEAGESFDEHIRKEIDLTVCFLKEYTKAGAYTGPKVLSDGFVVEFDGGRAVFPPQISGAASVDKSLIEESLKSGQMRTGSIDMSLVQPDEAAGEESVWAEAAEGSETVRDLSFGRISEDAVYAHVTSREEYHQFLELYKQNNLSAMKTAAEIYGGMTAIVYEENGQIVTLERFGDGLPEEDLQKLGLTIEDLESQSSGKRKVNGHRYRFTVEKEEGDWLGQDHVYIIQAHMMDSMIVQLLQLSVMVCLVMVILYITITTYALSEEEYTLKKILDTSEAERYNPKRIRRKLRSVAVVSAVMILALSFLTQSVIQMRQQTVHGQYTLQLLAGQLKRGSEELEEGVRKIKENRYLKYGHQISAFLTECPEAQTEEKLRECCAITGADFIMLFDHEGNEVLCSKDYDGFTMSGGLGESSGDFKRLLLGLKEVVHPVSLDKVTGLERQMIGVTSDFSGNETEHGALIMALLPGMTDTSETPEEDSEVSLLVPEGVICLEANVSTGEILYAEDPSLTGKTIKEIGLADQSLQDGYMDFGMIRGVHRLILTYTDEDKVFYYAEDDSVLRKENFRYGVLAAVLYTLALMVLLCYLLRDYNDNNYRKWVIFAFEMKRNASGTESAEQRSAFQEKMRLRMERLQHRNSGKEHTLRNFFIRISGWNAKEPEKRASTVFTLGLFVLLQLWVVLVPGGYLLHGTGNTLLDYLLHGDWMRGFNLFALYSILVCLAVGDLIILGSGWFLQILADCMGPKGQTVCRLLQSIIKFVTVAAVIFMGLSYVGFLNTKVLASMGIGSIALSLGAKDIVADILSGILIVFNETVRVGDVVEYQGMVATVRAVRIQSTQLVTMPENDIMTVRNQNIVNIINKSRTATVYKLTMQVRTNVPLEKIDAMMKEALPKMREGCPGIIGTPRYLGVVAMRSDKTHGIRPLMTIEVDTLCDLKDKLSVMVYVNSELHRLFAEEGIEVY